MSGVLHPVGPEPAAIYWLRRTLVLGVLALVVVTLTALVGPGGTKQQAVPAAATRSAVVDATPSSNVSPRRSAAGPGSRAASTAVRTPSTPAASARPRATASSARPARPGATSPSKASASTPPPLPSCAGSRLRTTLKGRDHLKASQPTTFDATVTNESTAPCLASVTGHNFTVTIYSGRDRIWSTRDCASAVASRQHQLSSQQALTWRLNWNGRRSAAGCQSRPETPRPGTYVATAQLAGAKPVRLRMMLQP